MNSLGLPGASASPTGRIPHERSRVAVKRSGVMRIVSPSTRSSPSNVPTPANRGRVEENAIALAPNVLRFGDRAVVGAIHQIESEAVLVGVADQAQRMERFHDFDPVGTDGLRHAVVGSSARCTHRPLPITATHRRERVDDAEVGVHAEPGDEERVAFTVDALVDATVVEVAVARAGVPHRQRHLMNRVFVERVELVHLARFSS